MAIFKDLIFVAILKEGFENVPFIEKIELFFKDQAKCIKN
jgi:hypothetical protein